MFNNNFSNLNVNLIGPTFPPIPPFTGITGI
ncbi:exosporium leader peptide-containing protein, partial [Bacillus thuringiensis]